ncbi:SGNH/GDSL hydrolase family protein [Desmospora activa]|uniref:Lysophospholipase L1-like esterase n=1 Tax=Desmospora activa DSM 45169 TaxID=1121389 RepID=A0A2T4Z9D5_9BACL|nr:GDSL-type esterase/lipase family protein [Desmospora activa]PTM58499.1 lysophospholipase L1-like esterase [Desmospora activa DSM 45169]
MRHSYYLAIGDSITVGVGASPGQGYAPLAVRSLKNTGVPLKLLRAARKGAISREVLAWTTLSPRLRAWIRQAQVISILIGGNDLLRAFLAFRLTQRPAVLTSTLLSYRANLHRIITHIRQLTPVPVFFLNQYNPFPRSPFAANWIDAFNRQIAGTADNWGIPLVDLHDLFLGQEPQWIDGFRTGSLSDVPLLGSKPIHPNNRGHQAIAAVVAATILECFPPAG